MSGVIFDLDETLLDRRGTLDAYARKLHFELDPQGSAPPAHFLDKFHRIDAGGGTPREKFFDLISSELLPARSPRELRDHFEAYAWQAPQLFQGVDTLLGQLRNQGLRLGIITNGGEASQLAKIVSTGLLGLVDCYVISACFGARKPDRAIFEYMTNELAIDPRTSWFVGDDPYCDIWGSKQCGYSAAWVERSAWPKDLSPCYDARIDSVLEMREIVRTA